VRGFHANGSTRDKISSENTKQSKSLEEMSPNINILQEAFVEFTYTFFYKGKKCPILILKLIYPSLGQYSDL
jgi:hypothetical protein